LEFFFVHGSLALPKGWRLVVLVLLLFCFPILFHPWWLFAVSVAAYGFLLWLLLPPKNPE
jgi:hypothetical protein